MLPVCRIADAKDIEGCTEEEIAILCEKQKVSFLPEVYRQFLLYLGKGAGDLYKGIDAYYKILIHLKDEVPEILEFDESSWVLPDDAFVFYMYIGQQFFSFILCY